jgi:hypothetical protein
LADEHKALQRRPAIQRDWFVADQFIFELCQFYRKLCGRKGSPVNSEMKRSHGGAAAHPPLGGVVAIDAVDEAVLGIVGARIWTRGMAKVTFSPAKAGEWARRTAKWAKGLLLPHHRFA